LKKLLYAKGAQKSKKEQGIKEKNRKVVTRVKRTNEQRKGITRCESPSPRKIKQKTTKRSKQLVSRTIHILKHPSITLPPYTPHQAQRN